MEILAIINALVFPLFIVAMLLYAAVLGHLKSRRLWKKTHLFVGLSTDNYFYRYCDSRKGKIAPGVIINKGDLLVQTDRGLIPYSLKSR